MPLVKITTQVVRKRDDLPRIIKDYRWWDNAYVAVGWDAYSGRYPDGTLVAQVALFNEFGSHKEDGSVRSPARPFMRPAYQLNKTALDNLRRDVVLRVNAGKLTPDKGLNVLGYRMWQWIRARILSNTPDPLAPRTVAKKRREGRPAVTLIDTRRMLDTLTYKIHLGRLFVSSQTTQQAQQATANAKRITGDTAAKQRAKSQALRDKVMTAKQIKREKKLLRTELLRAQSAKRREAKALRSQMKRAKVAQRRESKALKSQIKRAKTARKTLIARNKRAEKRAIKAAKSEASRLAKRERRASRTIRRYVKTTKKRIASLSRRINKKTAAQKQAGVAKRKAYNKAVNRLVRKRAEAKKTATRLRRRADAKQAKFAAAKKASELAERQATREVVRRTKAEAKIAAAKRGKKSKLRDKEKARRAKVRTAKAQKAQELAAHERLKRSNRARIREMEREE